MTDGEQTQTTNPDGTQDNTNAPNDQENISIYAKTEAVVARQEAANKKTEELLARQETLHANQRLAGTSGGNVEVKRVSPEDAKTAQAQEFFKGTALGDAIKKTNG